MPARDPTSVVRFSSSVITPHAASDQVVRAQSSSVGMTFLGDGLRRCRSCGYYAHLTTWVRWAVYTHPPTITRKTPPPSPSPNSPMAHTHKSPARVDPSRRERLGSDTSLHVPFNDI